MQKIARKGKRSRKKRANAKKTKKVKKCANSERQHHHLHYPKKVAPKCKKSYRQRKKAEKSVRNAKKAKKINVQIRSDSATICITQKKLLQNANNSIDKGKKQKKARETRKKAN